MVVGLPIMAIFVAAIGFWAKHTRSRAQSLAALPVITWRLRLVTVMAGLWSVVAEAVVRACLTSVRYKGAWGRRGSVPRRVSRSATAFISAIMAKFGLGIIWLSEVRVGGLFRLATPLVSSGGF